MEKKILYQDFNEFKRRIVETIRSFDKDIINGTISSMHKRLIQITKNNGCRTKY